MFIFINIFKESQVLNYRRELADGEGSVDQGTCEQIQATNSFSKEKRKRLQVIRAVN